MIQSVKSHRSNFEVIDSINSFPEKFKHSVVAIGNFDGLHRGHLAVFDSALNTASKQDVPVIAVTFEPHPRTLFRPEHPVFRLSQPQAKADILRVLGFDGLLVIPFNHEFAEITAESFVRDILVDKLNIMHVVIGYDFHFGKNREGTPQYLKDQVIKNYFSVTIVEPFEDEQSEIVSSSRIREALSAGDIVFANYLLGYRWFVDAEVQHGEKRGRTLGFPTANLHLPEEYRLQLGIYAVRVYLDGKRFDGVASYGRRPTFDNGAPILEVFIFDFSKEIYGETIRVAFCSYLRTELKFSDIDSLIAQMNQDVLEAKSALSSLKLLSELDIKLDMGFETL